MRTQALLLLPSTGVLLHLSSKSRDLPRQYYPRLACRLVYVEKFGLGGVIDNCRRKRRTAPKRTGRTAPLLSMKLYVCSQFTSLRKQDSRARPVIGTIVELGPNLEDAPLSDPNPTALGAHNIPSDLIPIRSLSEIPVIAPFALDSFRRSVHADAKEVIAGLARGIVEASSLNETSDQPSQEASFNHVHLTPLRLMIAS